ncbi:aminoacyl-tRNA hydrolase [Candidatus Daviesbacteria bacterium RIFCSPLOWO2_02_FULL_36_8]|uniref:Peptidyl-tRNA hydrolase n=1 Tax=Candidatus Daviesbacteria bacterium RIFCSPLOWO2_02_FULL_36_8 TaxID=1797793 RepID=A0A1F5MFJ5_9BACT|nr:MAG: aminoacyl-tRNA hydrolase [Candidatus Daviesbacteria bacterium RIFCSPLOWO2_02_FULL_36_8]
MKKILIIGLGNPGDKYIGVRHNLGFMVLDAWVKKMALGEWSMEEKFKAEIIKQGDLIFAKPLTFMNNSGLAVSALVNYFKINPEDVIIVYDELDLPLGKIKVRAGGAAAGHHGVESIIESLGTDKFIRVRLGIGNLKTQNSEHHGSSMSAEKYVLEPFTHSEGSPVKHMIKQALRALDELLEKGLEYTQNQFN